MQMAKCEDCGAEVQFETYKRDWPLGWAVAGWSRWGKAYHRYSHAWWCPACRAAGIEAGGMPSADEEFDEWWSGGARVMYGDRQSAYAGWAAAWEFLRALETI